MPAVCIIRHWGGLCLLFMSKLRGHLIEGRFDEPVFPSEQGSRGLRREVGNIQFSSLFTLLRLDCFFSAQVKNDRGNSTNGPYYECQILWQSKTKQIFYEDIYIDDMLKNVGKQHFGLHWIVFFLLGYQHSSKILLLCSYRFDLSSELESTTYKVYLRLWTTWIGLCKSTIRLH